MKLEEYLVRLSTDAEHDLWEIQEFLKGVASAKTASIYVDRILDYLATFSHFPERGTLRNEIRPGLRIVGFEKRISVAFVVEEDCVTILRILYAGRNWPQEAK